MFEVKVLNKRKKILMLKWSGIVKKEEVAQANIEMQKCFEREFNSEKFYLLVNAVDLKVFSPDTKEEIIKQQQLFGPMLIKVADVIPRGITKVQLKEANEKAKMDLVTRFDNFDEGLRFLENLSR